MTETINIKKSTLQKVIGISVCIIVISSLGYVAYHAIVIDHAVFTTDVSLLQQELASTRQELSDKTVEVARLEKQIDDLESEVSSQDNVIESRESTIEQLNSQIADLESQLAVNVKEIRDLTEQVEILETLVKAYQNPTPTPIP